MIDPRVQSLLAVGVSALFSAALLLALRKRVGGWLLLLLGLSPAALIYLTNPCVRIYQAHGFAHVSMMYQILNGFVPPDNPLLGGEPQLYPWMHGLLTAGLVFAFRIPPTFAFALINLLALAGSLTLVYRAAHRMSASRVAGALSATLSVLGLTFLNQGAVTYVLRGLTGPAWFEWRALGADKFTNVNAMPLGILFFALFVYSLVRIFSASETGVRPHVWLLVSVVGSGLFYPLVWTGLIASFCAVVVTVAVFRGNGALGTLGRLLAVAGVGTLLLLPYFRQISGGSGAPALSMIPGSARSGASFLLAPDLRFVSLKLARWSLYVLPLSVLLVWKRRALAAAWRSQPRVWTALWAVAATGSGLYVLVTVTPPLSNEYKYLVLACMPLGIAGGLALSELYRTRAALCALVLALFLVPAAGNWIEKFFWHDCNRAVAERIHLRDTDPQRDELYRWIGERTPRDALFIDDELTIPVFGRRQLYIGLGQWFEEGWTTAPREILLASHYSARQIYARETVAGEFFSRPGAPLPERTLSELRRTSGDREVYVVLRNRGAESKLIADPNFTRVFANDAAVVYKLLRDAAD
jgi:hypothetical protein